MNVATWSAPVVAVPALRWFLYDATNGSFVEVTDPDALDAGSELPWVSVAPAGSGTWRLEAEDYAGPFGSFALVVTRPLPAALAIFAAALAAVDRY